jgi:virginiamycin B lyase
MAVGPDGNVWITLGTSGGANDYIVRLTTAGSGAAFPTPSTAATFSIVAGPDGRMWFLDIAGVLGHIDVSGLNGATMASPKPFTTGAGWYLTVGPDGALWFTEQKAGVDKIGRETTSGSYSEFPITPSGSSSPHGIVTGPDGNLWFTDTGNHAIARMTPTGTVTEWPVPTGSAGFSYVANGPVNDRGIWVAEATPGKLAELR